MICAFPLAAPHGCCDLGSARGEVAQVAPNEGFSFVFVFKTGGLPRPWQALQPVCRRCSERQLENESGGGRERDRSYRCSSHGHWRIGVVNSLAYKKMPMKVAGERKPCGWLGRALIIDVIIFMVFFLKKN